MDKFSDYDDSEWSPESTIESTMLTTTEMQPTAPTPAEGTQSQIVQGNPIMYVHLLLIQTREVYTKVSRIIYPYGLATKRGSRRLSATEPSVILDLTNLN